MAEALRFFGPDELRGLRAPIPERPSDEIAHQRLKAVFEAATPLEMENGMRWYFDVNSMLTEWLTKPELSAVPSVDHAAGITAALSVNTPWVDNVKRARELMRTGDTITFGHARDAAQRILAGEMPSDVLFEPHRNNPKVRAFYLNMSNPHDHEPITIDRHMIGLLHGDSRTVDLFGGYIRKKDYPWAAGIFRAHAAELEILPHQLQATSWVVWRRMMGVHILSEVEQPALTGLEEIHY